MCYCWSLSVSEKLIQTQITSEVNTSDLDTEIHVDREEITTTMCEIKPKHIFTYLGETEFQSL